MNMTRVGGAALTAGSNVSSVTLAVLCPQSLPVGVHSGMLGRHLQHSGTCQASFALWNDWHVFVAFLGSSGIFV